jgi:hypothetical protein
MLRRTCIATGLLVFAVNQVGRAASIPIFEYRFNDSGTTSSSTGSDTTLVNLKDKLGAATDLHGAAGSGVSGLPGDLAFNNTASTMGGTSSTATGGVARQPGKQGTVDGLTSFTVSGWFKTDTSQVGNNAILINNLTTGGFMVRSATNGTLTLEMAGGFVTTPATYTAIGSWVFYAVSYNGTATSNNVTFYQGTTSSAPVQVGSTLSLNSGGTGTTTDPISIGNGSLFNRAMDASMDDTRVYGATSGTGGVLTLADLNGIWSSDIANTPEPSTCGLLLMTSVPLAFRRARQAR